jgi:hypothetical protein
MIIIPVPSWVYLLFLSGVTIFWVVWVVTDIEKKGISKYSLKRVLTYIVSGAVLGLLWGVFVA